MSIQEDYTIVHLFSVFTAKSWQPRCLGRIPMSFGHSIICLM